MKVQRVTDLDRHERKAVDALFQFALACGINALDATRNVGFLEQAVREVKLSCSDAGGKGHGRKS